MSNALKMLVGSNRSQQHGFHYMSFAEIADKAASPVQGIKDQAPICAPHDATAKTKDVVLAHDNFTMLWIDVDEGNKKLAWLMAFMQGMQVESYVIYTTASSQPDAKRWRVLIELSQAISFEHWNALQSYLVHKMGADNAATRPQQILYLPIINANTAHYEHHINEGAPLDPHNSQLITDAIAYREECERKALEKASQAPQAPARKVVLSAGQKSPIELFNAAYEIAPMLEAHGFKKLGKRYLHPKSTSGQPAIILFADSGKYFSHHGCDPLADGFPHDAFDVYCELVHGGDFDAAVKAAANDLDPDGQKQRQREHMQQQDATVTLAANAPPAAAKAPAPLFSIDSPYNLFGEFPAPEIPMELVPPAIAEYCKDQGEIVGADAGAMVVFCLVVVAASISDEIKIQPKKYDTSWLESARLWGGVIGDPSVKKSPLLGKAIAPMKAIESEWRKDNARKLAKWAAACKKADENGNGHPPKPLLRRAIVEDTTTEKLDAILAESEPRGVLCYRDELKGWLASMDAYRGGIGGKDKAAWLQYYNGGEAWVDRISRPSLHIPNRSACVVGGIQPEVIQSYASSTDNDGMLQRFILYFAHKYERQGVDRKPNSMAKSEYEALVKYLAKLDCGTVKLSDGAHKHRASLDAKAHWLALHHNNAHVQAALGKWGGLYARLLLVWHCCDAAAENTHPAQLEVKASTAENVSRFMLEVLLPHTLKFYSSLDPVGDEVNHLARLILATRWQRFTVGRDFNQHWSASRKMKPWEVKQTLDRLDGYNWIAPDPHAKSNERGEPTAYMVNPEVHKMYKEQAKAERERREMVRKAMTNLKVS